MRLSKTLIDHIAAAIAANLETKKMAAYTVPRASVAARINEAINANMAAEERLNADVEKLLAGHESEIARGGMDRRKVFELTKQKLAKERGIVL